MFTSIAASSSALKTQVVSLRVLPEARRLSIILGGGDITMVTLDEDEPVVRSVIQAMS